MSAETLREFIDTDVLVYAHDTSAGDKHVVARELLAKLWSGGHLSWWLVHSPTSADVIAAIQLHQSLPASFWDAMIIVSARRLECTVLWSEDLNDGQIIEGVGVRNPFRARAGAQ